MGKGKKATRKIIALDKESDHPRVMVKCDTAREFFCYRCDAAKISKTRFEWTTTQGLKLICNGCHGVLAKKAKNRKETQERLAATGASVVEADIDENNENGEDGDECEDYNRTGWAKWRKIKGSRGCRSRQFIVPYDNWMEIGVCRSPIDNTWKYGSVGRVTYTVVSCGYTSRIPIASLPNAFWARDGSGPGLDQRTTDAAKDIAQLTKSGVSTEGSFMYRGLADIEHLMSFRHCGCFNHCNLLGAEMLETNMFIEGAFKDNRGAEKSIRILYLAYDTELG